MIQTEGGRWVQLKAVKLFVRSTVLFPKTPFQWLQSETFPGSCEFEDILWTIPAEPGSAYDQKWKILDTSIYAI